MSECGWIKLHRRILNWEWSDEPNVIALWIHLLLNANFENSKYKGFDIPAGSLVYGHEAFSNYTGLSVMQVRTALKKLEKSKNVTIKRTNKFSIISITKWKEYQDVNRQVTGEQQASNRQVTAYKEGKKERRKETPLTPQGGNGSSFFIDGVFDVRKFMPEYCIEIAKENAPGWDLEYLYDVYNEGINSGQREMPIIPPEAFAAWCKLYTKGKRP